MKGEGNKVAQGTEVLPVEKIEQLIWLIRGEKVILDSDIAALYGVETKVLLQAVRRGRLTAGLQRFPIVNTESR
ncbi:MAG: ORF6N domain-containing protein [Candidatus Hatepunaea meridiana]|nr:ORF6N domain-containing protein [Candidatus Hatepunaea meridiana]